MKLDSVKHIGLKHEIYARIEETCPGVEAICSVSSSFVPDVLAEKAGKYKDRIIVTHPFNPNELGGPCGYSRSTGRYSISPL
jgi:3-hydroxyacyl-CoA dehydrogenase